MPWHPFKSWKLKDTSEAKQFQKLLEGETLQPINDSIDDEVYILIGKCIVSFQHLEDTMIAVISRYFGPSALISMWALLTDVRFAEILESLRRINKVNELCDQKKMKTVCDYAKKISEHRNLLVHSYFIGASRPDGGVQVVNRRKSKNENGRLERRQLEEFIEDTKNLDSFIRYLLLRPPH